MSELSPSIEEKLQRIRELDVEKERLSREIESEYYTTERLNAFWERYRTMTRAEMVPLLVGAAYDENFARCYRFCLANRLFAFGERPEIKQPPLPVDDKFGPAPVIDWEARKAAADRITAEHHERLAEVRPAPPVDERGVPMTKRLDEVAARTADFDTRLEEARKIGASISDAEMKKSSPVQPAAKGAPDTLEQVREQIASDNAELEKRRAEAKRIQDDRLAEAEQARQTKELPTNLQKRTARPVTPATPAAPVTPKI